MGRATSNCFWPRPLGPWGGAKRSNIILLQLQSQFQRFLYQNFVCVLINKRYKTYQTGFASCRLGHAPGVGLWGAGVPRGSKNFKYGHVAYQIDGDDEQNRMQVKFSP